MQAVNEIKDRVNYLILVGFVIVLGIIYFTMTEDEALQSLLISISFVYVCFLFFTKLINKAIDRRLIRILIASIVLVFFNVTLSGSGGFNYYKKAIMFSALLMWFAICLSTQISRATIIWIYAINILIAALYHIFYKEGLALIEGDVFLTLNFSNPNLAGMFIMNTLLYLAIFIVAGRAIFNRKYATINLCVAIPIFITVFGLLIYTGNRSSILSILIFIVLIILELGIKKQFWRSKLFCFIVAIIPFLFVFWYINYAGDLDTNVTLGADPSGKTNTSRNHVWVPIINSFFHYFYIGDYYGISNGTGYSQMHNTHLDIYASYGFAVLVLYIAFLYKILRISFSKSCSLFTRCAVYAFIATSGSSCFEAGLVAGSGGFYILTGGFLLFANYRKREGVKKDDDHSG